MNSLPRDIQLQVIKNFDIDTRVKLGIPPCKLKVPESLKKALEKLQSPRLMSSDDYIYTVKTAYLLISWDEALEQKSIGLLHPIERLYEYWIAVHDQTAWLDVYEYMGEYNYVDL
jgi:hypothetical protein